MDCKDGSDELCHDECYKSQEKEKMILRRCQEDAAICVPVSKYCDIVYDCPFGSDEVDCSCDSWNMKPCEIGGTNLCIYNEWLGQNTHSSSCLDLLENQAIDPVITIEECMGFGQHGEEEVVETTTTDNMVTSNHLTLDTGNKGRQNTQILSEVVIIMPCTITVSLSRPP